MGVAKANNKNFLSVIRKFLIFKLCAMLGMASLWSCQSQAKLGDEKSVQEIKDAAKISNSSIIRNPVSVAEPTDTVNVAKLVFSETSFNFGEVEEGKVVTHEYRFVNEGKVPLLIGNAKSTCGCTVPKWPKEPIEPGRGGTISVRFNTSGKTKQQRKPITITANTYPSKSVVYLEGFVKSKEEVN